MCFTKRYCKRQLLLAYCIFLVSHASCNARWNCCGSSPRMIDCVYSNVTKLPKPQPNAVNWCEGDVAPNGESIINISLTDSRIKLEKDVFADYPNVINITMDKCNLSFIEANVFRHPKNLSQLRYLSLVKSQIKSLDAKAFEGLTSLELLDLSFNQIEDLPLGVFDSLANLNELRLHGNKLTSLKASIFSQAVSLRMLYLSSNSLETLESFPESIANLKELYLQNNSIGKLNPNLLQNLKNLGIIDVSDNRLESLDENFFRCNHDIYSINLRNNELNILPQNTFRHLCNLGSLDIRNNKLKTPYFEWFANVAHQSKKYPKRSHSVVSGNNWACDCNAAEYAEFIMKICYDREYEDKGLMKYFNIECSSGGTIVAPKSTPKLCSNKLLSCGDKFKVNKSDSNLFCKPLCRFIADSCYGNLPTNPRTAQKCSPRDRSPLLQKQVFVPGIAGVGIVILILVGLMYFVRNRRKVDRKRHDSECSDDMVSISELSQSTGYKNCTIPEISDRQPGDGCSQPPSSPPSIQSSSENNSVVYDPVHDSSDSLSQISSWADFSFFEYQNGSSTRRKSIISSGRISTTDPKQLYEGSSDQNAVHEYDPNLNRDYTPMKPLVPRIHNSVGNDEPIHSSESRDSCEAFSSHKYEQVPNTVDGYEQPILHDTPPSLPNANPPKRSKISNRQSGTELLLYPEQFRDNTTLTGNWNKKVKSKKVDKKSKHNKKRRK